MLSFSAGFPHPMVFPRMAVRYHLLGLTLESALECPELLPAPVAAPVDVRIGVTALSPALA